MRPATVLLSGLLALFAASCAGAASLAPKIVAAENFYGDVARQIAGPRAAVTSVLSNPDEDPHLFEASPSVARAVAKAGIVVYNGVAYDPWMAKLLGASPASNRKTLVVGDLLGKKPGDNPHIWYDPATMPVYAKALAAQLTAIDPMRAAGYRRRLARFLSSLTPLQARIATLRKTAKGKPAIATEPVFGYMLAALGMPSRDGKFQLAAMNNAEPSARDVARFENDLKQHKVDVLIYNSQAPDPVAQRMMRLAKAAHIPIVGASETEPAGATYQQWMARELDALAIAIKSK